MASTDFSIPSRFDRVNEKEHWSYRDMSSSDAVSLSVRVAQLGRYIGSTSKKLLDNVKGHAFAGVLKLTTIATLPFSLYEIAESIYNIAKTTLNEKVDLVLATVSTIGGVLDVVSNIGEGLSAIGAVTATAVKWATPLNIAAVVIESVGMVLTTKSLIETYRFSVVFNEAARLDRSVEEYDIEDYRNARKVISEAQSEEKSLIGKHFKTDADKLLSRLLAIETEASKMLVSGNPSEVIAGKRKLQMAMQALSGRMTAKEWSNGLSLLAGTVGIVGFGVLFSPCPPAGFALLAISSVMSIGNYFLDRYLTANFEKDLAIS